MMRIPRQNRTIRLRHAALGAAALSLALAAGCASSGAQPESEYNLDVRFEPPGMPPTGEPGDSAAANGTMDALPTLPLSQLDTAGAAPIGDQRRVELEANGEDLRVVLRGLAESYGLGHRISSEVDGRVSTRLRDVTLTEALDELLGPPGERYSYQVQEGVLRVGPAGLASATFSLDYIALTRVAATTTAIQERIGGGGRGQAGVGTGATGGVGTQGTTGGAGTLGTGSGGGSVISSSEAANLWEGVRLAMEALLFDEPTEAGAEAARTSLSAAGSTPAPYTRVGPDGRRLIINPMAGTVFVTAPPARLREIEAYIQAFEGAVHRQVLIEARIVEVVLDREFQFGINWTALRSLGSDVELDFDMDATTIGSGGASTVELRLGGGLNGVTAIIEALDRQGEVRVLSSPSVSTLSNQRAIMDVTTDEVFFNVTRDPILGPNGGTIGFETNVQQQQIPVGIVLDVLPQIAEDNTITMNVRPQVTDVLAVRSIEIDGLQAQAPVIDRRSTNTVVRVRDGETIVIGGLMQTRSRTERTGVPVLMNVPLLGRLFRSERQVEEKRELVIFLTPTVVAGQAPAGQ